MSSNIIYDCLFKAKLLADKHKVSPEEILSTLQANESALNLIEPIQQIMTELGLCPHNDVLCKLAPWCAKRYTPAEITAENVLMALRSCRIQYIPEMLFIYEASNSKDIWDEYKHVLSNRIQYVILEQESSRPSLWSKYEPIESIPNLYADSIRAIQTSNGFNIVLRGCYAMNGDEKRYDFSNACIKTNNKLCKEIHILYNHGCIGGLNFSRMCITSSANMLTSSTHPPIQ